MELEEKKIIIKNREKVDWTVLTDWLPVGRKDEEIVKNNVQASDVGH